MSDSPEAWWDRLQRILANLLALVRTRLDLVAVETEVFVSGVIEELVLGVFAVLLATLALAFLGLGVIVAVAEAHRPWAFGGVGLVYLGCLWGCLLWTRRRRRLRGGWLRLTQAELQADIRALEREAS
jgi:uncharacterized membrane protein YqjE